MESGGTDDALVVQRAAEPVLVSLLGRDPVDRAQIPDLIATVVERVLRRLREDDPLDDLAHYAKQVARNTFNDWARRMARERKHLSRGFGWEADRTLAERIATSSPTPGTAVVAKDDQQRHAPMIRAALANLSAMERSVLDLRFVKGRTSAEVAELLGYRSAGVVDTLVSRARKKLRTELPVSLIDPFMGR